MKSQTALERAYELARSGAYANAAKVVDALRTEGLDHYQVEGQTLRRQLTDLCRAAQGKGPLPGQRRTG